ncbi:MAG: hypothetical protein AB1427_10605 [Thermodesulfobacteriota bacterium]
MDALKNVLRSGSCILIMIAFIGCATYGPNNLPTEVYQPRLPAGITTFEAALWDLSGFLEQGKYKFTFGFKREYFDRRKMDYYVGTPSPSFQRELAEGAILKGQLLYFASELQADTWWIELQDDMLEATFRLFVLFAELPGLPITVTRYESGGGKISLGDQIYISGWWNGDFNNLQRIADDLYFIQQNYQKHMDAKLAQFEKQAARYRSLAVKPPVSEELRKYIVQANAARQNREYGAALHQYFEAVELDALSYPEAYFNMALLSAQGKRYEPAIRYMKQYLMLVPDAKDARSAQDKIYEWEFMMRK